jgi:tetratricopeptide (TPR) repeat protein
MIREMIDHELARRNVEYETLAGAIGVQAPSIRSFINGEYIEFQHVLKMTKYLFPERERELMKEYILTSDIETGKIGLEYCMTHSLLDTADVLIDRLRVSNEPEDIEWAMVYELHRKGQKGVGHPLERIQEANQMHPKTREMFILLQIGVIYDFFDVGSFEKCFELAYGLEYLIPKVDDVFLRGSLNVRLGQTLSAISLHINQLEEARKYVRLVLDHTDSETFREMAYHNLGNTFILDDFDKALYYLKKSNIMKCKGSINFLHNYWDVEPPYLNFESMQPDDVHDVAFHLIRKGETSEAKKLLEGIHLSTLDDYKLGFHYYYVGLITKHKEDFFRSIKHFEVAGHNYFRRCPLKELEKLGEK